MTLPRRASPPLSEAALILAVSTGIATGFYTVSIKALVDVSVLFLAAFDASSISMDARQARMALAALGWTWDDLARRAEVSRPSVARFLGGDALGSDLVAKLRDALERGDETGRVAFIMSGQFKGGVCFRPAPSEDRSGGNPTLRRR